MTKKEKLIVSAYTGILMVDMEDYLKFIEKRLGRPVQDYEFAFKDVVDQIKKTVEADFKALCEEK
jgi:hypothetical protein